MPLAAVIADALTTPLTPAQLPFPLFVNGNEISRSGADATSYDLSDPGFTGPQVFTFTITDRTGAIAAWLARQQPVLWWSALASRYLFQGQITDIARDDRGPYMALQVTCQDLSSVALDYARPIVSEDVGPRGPTDRSMIESLVGLYSHVGGMAGGGYIQALNGAMPASVLLQRTDLRTALDEILGMTGVAGAVEYVDALGYLHTLSIGDVAAPFDISDAGPPWTSAIPALVSDLDQGAEDVDALYVYGATAAATGPVYAWQCGFTAVPSDPLRWATLDAPQASTQAAAIAVATVEFQRRMSTLTVTVTVTTDTAHGQAWDGWYKGQLLHITSRTRGWTAKPFTISAVDMKVINGKGDRQYVLTCNQDPVVFTNRLRRAIAKATHIRPGSVAGRVGGAGNLAGAG